MKEIFKHLIKQSAESNTCVLLSNGEWFCGRVIGLSDDELVWFQSIPHSETKMHWTNVIRIKDISQVEFRSDSRPLSNLEKEELGLVLKEELDK